MNKRLKRVNSKVYTIFNNVDFTNDHMLKVLTAKLAEKTKVYIDIYKN